MGPSVSTSGLGPYSTARERGVWGVEAVLALYAAVIVVGMLALLASLALNLARGITAHDARQRSRRGQPLPPLRCATLASGLTRVCCGA